jgi:hypothetical protein
MCPFLQLTSVPVQRDGAKDESNEAQQQEHLWVSINQHCVCTLKNSCESVHSVGEHCLIVACRTLLLRRRAAWSSSLHVFHC